MKLNNLRLAGAMLALVSLTAMSTAQGPQQGGQGGQRQGGGMRQMGGGMMSANSNLGLMERSDVQKDLKMTPQQITAMAKLREDMGNEMRGMLQDAAAMGDREAMREMMQQVNAKYDKAALNILDEGQQKRLTEIRIQLLGIRAIAEPDVQKALEMSNAQRQKVRSAQSKMQEAMQAMRGNMRPQQGGEGGERPNRGGMSEDMQAQMQKINADYEAALKLILTDEQNALLKTMAGAEFKADPNAVRGGRARG